MKFSEGEKKFGGWKEKFSLFNVWIYVEQNEWAKENFLYLQTNPKKIAI
jgi:hypothetical protein